MLRPLEQPKYSEHGDVVRISLTSHRAFALVVPVSWRKRNPSQTAPLQGPQRFDRDLQAISAFQWA